MGNLASIKAEVLRIVEDHIDALNNSITTHVNRAQRSIEDHGAFDTQKRTGSFQSSLSPGLYNFPDDFVMLLRAMFYQKNAEDSRYTFIEEVTNFETIGIKSQSTGPPKFWTRTVGGAVEFYPTHDGAGTSISVPGAYDVFFEYSARLVELVADEDTNWWSENMDDVLAWKAIANVYAEMRDPMAQFWNAVAFARFLEIKSQHKRSRMRSFATLAPAETLGSRL